MYETYWQLKQKPFDNTADPRFYYPGEAHQADRPPTSEEEQAADRALADPELTGDQEDVGKHYREMTDLGVNAKGEGRIP